MSRTRQPSLGLTPPSSPPRSTMEDAAVYIRRLIFDGELKAGIRVPQDQLAAAMGRSRVPGNFFLEVPDAAAVEKKGVAAIRRSIAARKADDAAAAYRTMLARHANQVVQLLEDRDFFG